MSTRAVLAGYSLEVLRILMYGLAIATTAAYALYTQDDRTVTRIECAGIQRKGSRNFAFDVSRRAIIPRWCLSIRS